MNSTFPDVLLLSCGIGRGHPFYLDGIAAALSARHPEVSVDFKTVFEIASPPARIGWEIARRLYHYGSQGGFLSNVYQALRSDQVRPARSWLLGHGLEERVREYRHRGTLVIVDHPILAAQLIDTGVWYQHGELIVPAAALVGGCSKIFVPTAKAADRFLAAGSDTRSIIVTGCCLEREIETHKKPWTDARQQRISSNESLTVGIFSSGAEPAPHLEVIARALSSLVRVGHTPVIFARKFGPLHRKVKRLFQSSEFNKSELIVYDNREGLHQFTMKRFESLDLFVAPYHERINWAVAAGLPLLGLLPTIGPFAPLNALYVKRYGCGEDLSIADATSIGEYSSRSKSRESFLHMSQQGISTHQSGGFQTIADVVANELKRR